MRCILWRCVFAALFFAILPNLAQSQVDPRGTYRTFRTPHFRVHFRLSADSIARRAAIIAEDAYAALSRELPTPDGPIELLLTDNLDLTNGYATVFPSNRIVIYLQPPAFLQELRFYGDWLRLVITHELAHIYQIDRARGLWSAGRKIFGRNPMFFPNAFTPSWVKEGIAVHYETALTGTGRLASTQFLTVARAAALEDRIPRPNQWSLATSRFPEGQTAYTWGSLLMERASSASPDSGMRRFVDAMGTQIIPFRLGAASRKAFGSDFTMLFGQMRDSMLASVRNIDTSGDARWRIVSQDGFYAAAPRWQGNDTLLWTASNGREVAGVFRAVLSDARDDGRRLNWRNSLDANVPAGDRIVFAQHDFRDPFVYRTDLYSASGWRERQLTSGARLTQPDVRHDGEIVAARIETGITHLVLVSSDGKRITRLTRPSASSWAEPRWSPRGDVVAAVELLPSGEQRIVVLDMAGAVREIVSGGRAVYSSPSFTPDGARLVWASDRSGRPQLETAPLASMQGRADTTRWRDNIAVRSASNVTTGVFDPSVSPDGKSVAALLYRLDGMYVVVAPLDTNGPVAESRWYARSDTIASRTSQLWTNDRAAARIIDTLQGRRYNALRQLLPRYWTPIVGAGRLDDIYGVSSSGVDIANRHEWMAGAMFNSDFSETDGYASYRFAGLGFPLLDASFSQEWDLTLSAFDTAGIFLGDVARRRRFATMSGTFIVPRVRRSLSATFGAQFEMRKFASDSDAALGPIGGVTRRGTLYQSFFGTLSASTARSAARSISSEEGFSLTVSSSYRWRTDVPQLTDSWRTVGIGRGFVPIPLPGFARHVLAARVAAGSADRRTASEFSVGGVSGIASQIVPGITFGEPGRTFPVRGVKPDAQRGSRALTGTLEYRAPLVLLSEAPGPIPLFADKLALNVFSDAGRAWCPAGVRMLFASQACETRLMRDGWIVTVGAELSLDLAVQYDVPYRFRAGFGAPVTRPAGVPGGGMGYVTLGSFF